MPSTHGSRRGRGGSSPRKTPTSTNAGNKRSFDSYGVAALRTKRPRQESENTALTRIDIPEIVATVVEATKNQRDAFHPSTSPHTTTEELECQELGEQCVN